MMRFPLLFRLLNGSAIVRFAFLLRQNLDIWHSLGVVGETACEESNMQPRLHARLKWDLAQVEHIFGLCTRPCNDSATRTAQSKHKRPGMYTYTCIYRVNHDAKQTVRLVQGTWMAGNRKQHVDQFQESSPVEPVRVLAWACMRFNWCVKLPASKAITIALEDLLKTLAIPLNSMSMQLYSSTSVPHTESQAGCAWVVNGIAWGVNFTHGSRRPMQHI